MDKALLMEISSLAEFLRVGWPYVGNTMLQASESIISAVNLCAEPYIESFGVPQGNEITPNLLY